MEPKPKIYLHFINLALDHKNMQQKLIEQYPIIRDLDQKIKKNPEIVNLLKSRPNKNDIG